MTRERIKDFKEIILPFFTIYFLKENYEGLGKSDAEEFEKDFNEILNLAAKALEQQPCEDAISRQAAIDEIKSHYRVDNDLLEVIAYKISKLPSVQPKPKVGHWIFDEILDRNYYCSECKSMGVDYWDYCPYCGAKMIEPQESEET